MKTPCPATGEKYKLAYFVSHPIQYQAPLLRRLSQEPSIDLTVFFWSDHSIIGYKDRGFGGADVKWDVPLLGGYKHRFLPAILKSTGLTFSKPLNHGTFKALQRGNFDCVWLHGYWNINSILTMISAKLLGVPVMVRAEGTLTDRPRSLVRLAGKKLFFSVFRHFIAAVLPIGEKNRLYWKHYLGEHFPSFDVPYAVDNSYFRKATSEASGSREQFRAELKLAPGRPIILYASKLTARKRCVDLVNAFVGIGNVPSNRAPYLLIVGEGEDRHAIEKIVRDSGSQSVRLAGFRNQSQLGRFFDLCDIFVLPSINEPFGLVVNEVMNAGRPVVISDQVGCQPDLIHDGVTGRVFPARDVGALRATLESMLSDPEGCRQMGQQALRHVHTWSFEQDVRGIERALNHIAKSTAGACDTA